MTAEQISTPSPFLAAALAYERGGIKITPLVHKDKGAFLDNWESTDLTHEDLLKHWGNGRPANIGIRLGDPSGGRVDVDLDSDLAVELAPLFLPETKMSGREGKDPAHYWYVSPGTQTQKFMPLPGTKPFKPILELRSTGHQTVAPPSVYENGDICLWFNPDKPMTHIDSGGLEQAVRKLATTALIASNLPDESRHDIAMALTSILMGRRLDRLDEEETLEILGAAWDAAGYPKGGRRKAQNDLLGIVSSTHRRLKSGDKKVRGLPFL